MQIRLGVVTGLNLAEMCRLRCATPGFAPAAPRHTPRCIMLHATCRVASPARAAAVKVVGPGASTHVAASVPLGLRGVWAQVPGGRRVHAVGHDRACDRRVGHPRGRLRCNIVCCAATSCVALHHDAMHRAAIGTPEAVTRRGRTFIHAVPSAPPLRSRTLANLAQRDAQRCNVMRHVATPQHHMVRDEVRVMRDVAHFT